MGDAPSIFIVEDDSANLRLVAGYLDELGYQIRTFDSGVHFLESCQLHAPGCILLDNLLPGISGIEVQKKIVAMDSRLPVIFMSGNSSYEEVFEATKNGAFAFLQKPVTKTRLRATVEQALALSRDLTGKFSLIARVRTLYANLSEREKEVFHLLVDGKPNKMIARKLAISLRTVEYHRANIQKKLQTTVLADLISIAKLVGQ